MSLWKRAGCQIESKAFEKSIVERISTNQQPPQRGGAIPDPVWVGSKWLLAFPRAPVSAGTPLALRMLCAAPWSPYSSQFSSYSVLS